MRVRGLRLPAERPAGTRAPIIEVAHTEIELVVFVWISNERRERMSPRRPMWSLAVIDAEQVVRGARSIGPQPLSPLSVAQATYTSNQQVPQSSLPAMRQVVRSAVSPLRTRDSRWRK